MKSSLFVFILVAVPGLETVVATAQPTQTRVALRAVAPANKGRHVSAKPGGGLMLGSKVLGNKETFALVDLNGGALRDGDAVRLQYDSGKRANYWRENMGKISRSGGKPDKNNAFKVKWKRAPQTLLLRAPSGKWVSGPGKGKELVTLAKADDPTLVWELIKNPQPAKKPAKSAKIKRP